MSNGNDVYVGAMPYGSDVIYEGPAVPSHLFRILYILNGANLAKVRAVMRERGEVEVTLPQNLKDKKARVESSKALLAESIKSGEKMVAEARAGTFEEGAQEGQLVSPEHPNHPYQVGLEIAIDNLGVAQKEHDAKVTELEVFRGRRAPAITATVTRAAKQYDTEDVEQLLAQTVNEIMRDGNLPETMRGEIRAHVETNMYSGHEWNRETGVLTVPSVDAELTILDQPPHLASANEILNIRAKELTVDPTTVLSEDKLKLIVLAGWEDGKIPDAVAVFFLGLPQMQMYGFELPPEAENVEDKDGYFAAISRDQAADAIGYVNRVQSKFDSMKNAGTLDGKRPDELVDEVLPSIVVQRTSPLPDVDSGSFFGNKATRKRTIEGWIDDARGTSNPTVKRDGIRYHGFKDANNNLMKILNDDFDSLTAQAQAGDLWGEADGLAVKLGMKQGVITQEDYIAHRQRELFKETVGVDEFEQITENSRYSIEVEEATIAYQQQSWTDPAKVRKDLNAALANTPEAHRDDKGKSGINAFAATLDRLSDPAQQKALDIWKASGGDIQQVIGSGVLGDGIRDKNKKEFTREDAKKQVKDFLIRQDDPVKLSDLSDKAQQDLITDWMKQLEADSSVTVDSMLEDMQAAASPATYTEFSEIRGVNVRAGFQPTRQQEISAGIGKGMVDDARSDIAATAAGLTEEEKREAREEASLAEEKRFNKILTEETSRKTFITNVARDMGIISDNSPIDFVNNFIENVIPVINIRASLSGAKSIDEYRREIMSHYGQVSAADKNYEDYARQYGTQIPTVPGLTPTGGVQAEYRPSAKALMPDPVFDVSTIRPELREMAFNRPEFAQFLAEEMKDPAYMREFMELGRTRVDMDAAEETMRAIEGGRDAKAVFDIYGRKRPPRGTVARVRDELQGEMEKARTAYEGAQRESDAKQAFAKYQQLRDEYSRAPQPGEDLTGLGGPSARRALYELKTRPGMSTEEFFRSKLPGFEEGYKKTGFFRQEEERLTREREREETTAEAQRRARLRRGGGGGGQAMAVFRQARV